MISEQSKLNKIVELFNEASVDTTISSKLDHISKKIEFDIPQDVLSLINLNEEANDPDLPWLFDSDIYSADEIVQEYENMESGFFELFGIDQDFNVSTECELELRYASTSEEDKPDEIVKNVARFLPVGRERGDYLVIDLLSGSLLSVELGNFLLFMAPSIGSHLNDLLLGIEEGVYKFDDHGELDYPREWEERVAYKSKK